MRKLRPHQRGPYKYAVRSANPALFLDMRYGKSLVATRAALRKGAKRVLVVGPISVLPGWEREWQLEGIETTWLLSGQLRPPGWAHGTTWALCGYDYLRLNPDVLTSGRWDAVMLDESVTIKNPSADITKMLRKHRDVIGSRWLLSGLPAPESLEELFSQFAWQTGEFMGQPNFWKWRMRCFTKLGFEWVPKPGARQAIREAMHARACVRTLEQAGFDVKPSREIRTVEATPEQWRLHHKVVKDYELDNEDTKWAPVAHSWLSQIAGGFNPETRECIGDGKRQELRRLLDCEFRNEQVVIGFRFIHELVHIWETLVKGDGETGVWMDGREARVKERARRIEKFQRGDARLFLVQMQCGKYGLNLANARPAVIYSNEWSLNTRRQFEMRIVDTQKKVRPLVLDLVSSLPTDAAVRDALLMKGASARLLMSNIQDSIRNTHGRNPKWKSSTQERRRNPQ